MAGAWRGRMPNRPIGLLAKTPRTSVKDIVRSQETNRSSTEKYSFFLGLGLVGHLGLAEGAEHGLYSLEVLCGGAQAG